MLTQTGGSLDYKVKDGVFSTKNILVEGDLFSIRGGGSYDIAKDNLDLALKVQLFKKSSLKSILLSPINIPVGELIEFHVFGSLDHPSWKTKYAKPLKILSGLIPGISNDEKNE